VRLVSIAIVCALAVLPAIASLTFTDVTESSGVAFRHAASKTSVKFLPETMGGGVAIFDADGDGRLDLFFTNGASITADTTSARPPDKRDPRFWNRLYRNLGGWKFMDVTDRSGVAGTRYDFGAAAADYDNDGDVDLHVTGLGGNTLSAMMAARGSPM
jgi:enediyne biosynthesis protein E4